MNQVDRFLLESIMINKKTINNTPSWWSNWTFVPKMQHLGWQTIKQNQLHNIFDKLLHLIQPNLRMLRCKKIQLIKFDASRANGSRWSCTTFVTERERGRDLVLYIFQRISDVYCGVWITGWHFSWLPLSKFEIYKSSFIQSHVYFKMLINC